MQGKNVSGLQFVLIVIVARLCDLFAWRLINGRTIEELIFVFVLCAVIFCGVRYIRGVWAPGCY